MATSFAEWLSSDEYQMQDTVPIIPQDARLCKFWGSHLHDRFEILFWPRPFHLGPVLRPARVVGPTQPGTWPRWGRRIPSSHRLLAVPPSRDISLYWPVDAEMRRPYSWSSGWTSRLTSRHSLSDLRRNPTVPPATEPGQLAALCRVRYHQPSRALCSRVVGRHRAALWRFRPKAPASAAGSTSSTYTDLTIGGVSLDLTRSSTRTIRRRRSRS